MKNTIEHYFCLDLGATGTRGALFDSKGVELARAHKKAGALSLGATQSFDAIKQVWTEVCINCAHNPQATRHVKIALGIAGYGLKKQREQLFDLLNEFASVLITGDGYGAMIAASKGKPGALISVGTGVGALRLGVDGKTLAVSSWGFPAGDAGGGAWLGLTLFSDFLNAMDMIYSNPPIPLALINEIQELTGTSTQSIMKWQGDARPGDFGQLAPMIVASAKTGDAYCQKLLRQAARQISRVAVALQTGEIGTVFLAGGLGKILYPYCLDVAPGIDWHISRADPIYGIFLLASDQAPLMHLVERQGQR